MKEDYENSECPKCGTVFAWDSNDSEPSKYGSFCPVCKDRHYTTLGIIYFQRKPQYLQDVSTA
jgi:hypothetical protein